MGSVLRGKEEEEERPWSVILNKLRVGEKNQDLGCWEQSSSSERNGTKVEQTFTLNIY